MIEADTVIHALPVFHQARQYLLEVIDRVGIVCIKMLNRTFDTLAAAIPCFFQWVSVTAEQYELALLSVRNQHDDRFRFIKSAEICEIAILTKTMLNITVTHQCRRRWQYSHRVFSHHAHQLPAAPCVNFFIQYSSLQKRKNIRFSANTHK